MRGIVALLLFLALTMAFAAGCQDKDLADDEQTMTQQTPSDPASADDPDVLGGTEASAGDEGGEAAEGEAAEGEAAGETEGTETETGSGDGMTNGTPAGPTVVFETTKGNIVLSVHPEWSPLGAVHFMELINSGFYNGAPWFRVIDGFVAQCGIAADPALNSKWGEKTINDEPVVQGNTRGMVAFGKSGAPNSRSTHIFINLVDNSRGLDPQGFSCFAEVIEGMDVADKLTRCEFGDQGALAAPGGLDKFKAQYPDADYIVKAYLK